MHRRLLPLLLALFAGCSAATPIRGGAIERASYEVTGDVAVVRLAIGLHNDGGVPVVVRAIEYDVRLGERTVVVGSEAVALEIPARGRAAIDLELPVQREALPASTRARIDAGQEVEAVVRGQIRFEDADPLPVLLRAPLAGTGR